MTSAIRSVGASSRAGESVGWQRAALLTALAAALLGAEWLIVLGAELEREPWWVWGLFPLFLFAAAFQFSRTARRLRGSERKVWMCFGLACFAYGSGETVWGAYDLFSGLADPFPAPAYLAYFSFCALVISGFWYSGLSDRSMGFSLAQLGNLSIVISAILLSYLFLFARFLHAPVTPAVAMISIVYCIFTLSAFLFGLIVVSLRVTGPLRRPMFLILVGLGAIAINDYHFTYILLNASYVKTDPLNGVYLVACSLFIWAAFERNHLRLESGADALSPEREERARRWEALLLPVAVAAVLVIAFLFRGRLTSELLPYVGGASVFFVISLAFRSWWGQLMEMRLRGQALASEAQLQLANRELRNEMKSRARAQEQLRHAQKMESLGQLTGGVAHDFNNLLAVILGNLELLEVSGRIDATERGFLNEAIDAGQRGAALTQRLLALSRKQALNPEPVDVGALLASMRNLLARTLGERVQVKVSDADSILRCLADAAQLESVLLNLAINARDAMPEGGTLEIEISRAESGVREIGEDPGPPGGAYIVISVRDTGLGIPAEILDRVFDPFFTTKDVGAGTGLGLSMAYGFARQSGGQITIDSSVGVGTEVRLYLPETELSVREDDDDTDGELPRGRGESLLIVEDEPAVRRYVVALLEGLGYVVRAASDGEEALEALGQMKSVDLLLSDVVLPGHLSGPRMAQEIERRRPGIRIVFMSGYAEDVRSTEGSNWPSHALLHKPFRKADLARKIRATLDA